jgi:excisionase family DNA binding protein
MSAPTHLNPTDPPAAAVEATALPRLRLLSIAEVADIFGRSPRTVRLWLKQGRLPIVRIGRAPFVPETAIDRLTEAAFSHFDFGNNFINENNSMDDDNA